MTLGTGKKIWYMHPDRTPLELNDFRIPVENICRYNGAAKWHLIKHLALGVLLAENAYGDSLTTRNVMGYFAAHDLHECVVGDVVTGMKKHLPQFQIIEQLWEEHVHNQIGLPLDSSIRKDLVNNIDLLALLVEMECLEHPALEEAKQNTGMMPTSLERQCFYKVKDMSAEECWTIITNAIAVARQEI
jgi:hypothetical protein